MFNKQYTTDIADKRFDSFVKNHNYITETNCTMRSLGRDLRLQIDN